MAPFPALKARRQAWHLHQEWVRTRKLPSQCTRHQTDPHMLVGPPPGAMPAPGVTPPPGIQQSQSPLPARPGNLPPNFAPPAGMPNINFNAPVIRLGTTGPSAKGDDRKGASESASGGARRAGLGSDYRGSDSRTQQRESMMSLQPPTREEIARTIFVSNITEGVGGDEGLERILRCAGSLRRWTRATDADNKPCKFGFAEFEDAESLETAAAIFQDGIEVPAKKQEPGKGEDEEVEMARLLVRSPDTFLSLRSLTVFVGRRRRGFHEVRRRVEGQA